MKFKVSGVNHDTGARMTLEFDATSKAAAEKKAQHQGMEVLHCHEMQDDDAGIHVERKTHRGEQEPGSGKGKYVVLIAIVVLIVGVAMFWGRIRGMIQR